MEQDRFVKLSELKKGDVVRSPQFVEGARVFRASTHNSGWLTLISSDKNLVRRRSKVRGDTLFAVAVIEERSYRSLIFFWKKYFVVELRPLKSDEGYDYDGQSMVVYPGLDSIDFFVEVVGQMNFNWSGMTHTTAPRP